MIKNGLGLYSILALMILLLTSCIESSSYTINYSISDRSTSAYIMIVEYNKEGYVVAVNTLDNCISGTIKSFKANDRTYRIRVHLKIEDSTSNVIMDKWVMVNYYLIPGNLPIDIRDDTVVSPEE